MADKTFVKVDTTGDFKESTGITTSAGVADGDKLVATNSSGVIDITLLPAGIGADTKTYPAFEDLVAGDFVNIFDDSGTKKARLAVASSNKRAHGFVKANYATAATATIYFDSRNDVLTGVVDGTVYYLSNTVPGGFQTSPPTTTGHILQAIGTGAGTNAISFEPDVKVVIRA